VLTTAMGTGWFVAVAPESPAAAAGLQTGDLVMAANGESLAGTDFIEANALLEVPAGAPLLLLMRRGAETAPFELTVHSLL
jgi:C-terminal processing protease CtpA/Prc